MNDQDNTTAFKITTITAPINYVGPSDDKPKRKSLADMTEEEKKEARKIRALAYYYEKKGEKK